MEDRVACLKVADENEFICNETYMDAYKYSGLIPGCRYQTIKNTIAPTLEDLLKYCCTYNINVVIPDNYNVTTLYNIIFSTGDFDPKDRTISRVSSDILFTDLDLQVVVDRFKNMCDTVGKENNAKMNSERYFCWHTEDFAYNQIIHSYSIKESYIIKKV